MYRLENSMSQREEFVRVALTWEGVPWQKVGSSREGVNCLGLLVGIARECGFLEDIAAKEHQATFIRPPLRGLMLKRAKEDLDPIPMEDVRPGDLLLFRFDGEPSHIAVVTQLNPLMIVHSDGQVGIKVVRHSVVPKHWIPVMAFKIRELIDD